jgi:lipoic acid synthetase
MLLTSAQNTVRTASARRIVARAATASSSRCLATATETAPEVKPKRRFPKLDDGLTFDDFVSGEPLPDATERVVLGNTSQCVSRSPRHLCGNF